MKTTDSLNKILSLNREQKEYVFDNFDKIASILGIKKAQGQGEDTMQIPADTMPIPQIPNVPEQIPSTQNSAQENAPESSLPTISDNEIISRLAKAIVNNSALSQIKNKIFSYQLAVNTESNDRFSLAYGLKGSLISILNRMASSLGEEYSASIQSLVSRIQEDENAYSQFVSSLSSETTRIDLSTGNMNSLVSERQKENAQEISEKINSGESATRVYNNIFSVPLKVEKDPTTGKDVVTPAVDIDFIPTITQMFSSTFQSDLPSIEEVDKKQSIGKISSLMSNFYKSFDDHFKNKYVSLTKGAIQRAVVEQYKKRKGITGVGLNAKEEEKIKREALASATSQDIIEVLKENPKLDKDMQTIDFYNEIGSDLFGYYHRWMASGGNNGETKISSEVYGTLMKLAKLCYGDSIEFNLDKPFSLALTSPQDFAIENDPERVTSITSVATELRSLSKMENEELGIVMDNAFNPSILRYLSNVNKRAATYTIQKELEQYNKNRRGLSLFCMKCGRFRQEWDKQETYVRRNNQGKLVYKFPETDKMVPVTDSRFLSEEALNMLNFKCDGTQCELVPNLLLENDTTQVPIDQYFGIDRDLTIGEERLSVPIDKRLVQVRVHESYQKNIDQLLSRFLSVSQDIDLDMSSVRACMSELLEQFFRLHPYTFTNEAGRRESAEDKESSRGTLRDRAIEIHEYLKQLLAREREVSGMEPFRSNNHLSIMAAREMDKLFADIPNQTYNNNFFNDVGSMNKPDAYIAKEQEVPFRNRALVENDIADGSVIINNLEAFNRYTFKSSRQEVTNFAYKLAFEAYESTNTMVEAEEKIKADLKSREVILPLITKPPSTKDEGVKTVEDLEEKRSEWQKKMISIDSTETESLMGFGATEEEIWPVVKNILNSLYSKVRPYGDIDSGYWDNFINAMKYGQLNKEEFSDSRFPVEEAAIDYMFSKTKNVYGDTDPVLITAKLREEIINMVSSKISRESMAKKAGTTVEFIQYLIDNTQIAKLANDFESAEDIITLPKVPESENMSNYMDPQGESYYPAVVDDFQKVLKTPDRVAEGLLKLFETYPRAHLTQKARRVIGLLSFNYLQNEAHSKELVLHNLNHLRVNSIKGQLPAREKAPTIWSWSRHARSLASDLYGELGMFLGDADIQMALGTKQGQSRSEDEAVNKAKTKTWYKKAQTLSEKPKSKIKYVLITSTWDILAAERNVMVRMQKNGLNKSYMPVIELVPFEKFGSLDAIYKFVKSTPFDAILINEKEAKSFQILNLIK